RMDRARTVRRRSQSCRVSISRTSKSVGACAKRQDSCSSHRRWRTQGVAIPAFRACCRYVFARRKLYPAVSRAKGDLKMARRRHQGGWLRTEKRSKGETWMLYFRTTRESDGKRVEHKLPIGLVRDLPSRAAAWKEVDRLHLVSQINEPDFCGRITF